MPTYQYRCTECGAELEVVQKFSDDALTVCPECSGRLRKVFNAVGVVFKGSGFYATDNRTKGKTAAAAPAKAEAKSESTGSDSTSSASASTSSSSTSEGSAA